MRSLAIVLITSVITYVTTLSLKPKDSVGVVEEQAVPTEDTILSTVASHQEDLQAEIVAGNEKVNNVIEDVSNTITNLKTEVFTLKSEVKKLTDENKNLKSIIDNISSDDGEPVDLLPIKDKKGG